MATSLKTYTENFLQLKRENQELKKKIKNLEKDMIHDGLTGLKTRKFFEGELKTNLDLIFEKRKHERQEVFGFKTLSILFLDIDNFKKINDELGHDAGDEVLKLIAKTLERNIRKTDVAARFGGEEFAVIFLGAGIEAAYAKAEKIRKAIEGIVFENFNNLKVTASIGVAEAMDSHISKIIKVADMAMYEAKNSGKNKTTIYSESLHAYVQS